MKKFKQGQTVYEVSVNISTGQYLPEIKVYHMHSHKTELPPIECIILKMPVNLMNKIALTYGHTMTRSRRKANRMLKELERKYAR